MTAPGHALRAATSAQVPGFGWLPPKLAGIRAVLRAWRLRHRYRRELERLRNSPPPDRGHRPVARGRGSRSDKAVLARIVAPAVRHGIADLNGKRHVFKLSQMAMCDY
jgi:hypothetical protein